ncbi:NAD(P)-binding protein [Lojkania enalia]|uniref:NAD(P)-binding protein n=1 Tax=Lojkania enalia TaxID=147567 RepID=A0A9P4K5D4_9PLEO|nr:NAD(P)-binding protein [Didymosphaeria enalia]
MAHPNRLQDANVLIFGGTSGIGFAVASLVLSQGGHVTISGSTQPKVNDKVAKLRSLYQSLPASNVSGHAVDLADTANLEKNLTDLFEKVTEGGQKKIDHIVFTAGDLSAPRGLADVTVEGVISGFNVRFISSVFIAKLIRTGKYMPMSPSSSFTVTGGVNTRKPMPGWVLPAAWGGASSGLVNGLAVELAPIRINCVEPGAIHTELLDKAIQNMGPGALDAFAKATLTKTVGEPSDCAEAYAYFMRDRFVTGTTAQTNGGLLLAPRDS